jgi:uncharacterized membrane protein (UPF0127 family)
VIHLKGQHKFNLPIQVQRADSFVSRFLGLMFRKEYPASKALHLIPCNSIHMFFMRFPLDVVFLDKESRIIHTVEGIRPWRVIPYIKKAFSTLELTSGSIKKYSLEVGDKLYTN